MDKVSFLKYNALRNFEPRVVAKIEKMIGKEFKVGFRSENGEVEALLVDNKAMQKLIVESLLLKLLH